MTHIPGLPGLPSFHARSCSKTLLLVRCDDLGLSHEINSSLNAILETEMPFSASIMPAGPYFEEAVETVERQSCVAAGIHLALTSDGPDCHCRPVMGAQRVPSLANESGFRFSNRAQFGLYRPAIGEIEVELRAQIEKALSVSQRFVYLDSHMNILYGCGEYRGLLEELAQEYRLELSHYFGEIPVLDFFFAQPSEKLTVLVDFVERTSRNLYLLITHPSMASQECEKQFLIENPPMDGRAMELKALTSPMFLEALQEKEIRLITYADLSLASFAA